MPACKIPALRKYGTTLSLCVCLSVGLSELTSQARAESGQSAKLPAGRALDADPPTKAVSPNKSSNLPPGYYIYLGPRPGTLLPKAFTIDDSATVFWQTASQTQAPPEAVGENAPAPTATQETQSDRQHQWDSYNYPLIKWKAHPITTIPGGVAQLETTFDPGAGMFGPGVLKYKLRLFRIARVPIIVTVQLLDTNGFKLSEFEVNQYAFHPIPGTQLLEATGEWACMQEQYSQARDYLVQ